MSLISGLPPELVWGLIPRFVGVVYVLAFAALIPQHTVMPGGAAFWPIKELHARMRRDLPGVRRFFEFPTLLWLSDGDTTLRMIPFVGTACGAYAIYGGPGSFYALLLAWMLWLSLECRALIFPWDTLLQEVGFLILFVPTPPALPHVAAITLPLPSVAFMVRWLVIRLMFGFGKEKFIGAKRSDLLYLRGFFVWMPLPTMLGWLAHRLPAAALRAMLAFMFLAEVIAPLLGFFTGVPRLISFGLMSALMLGIHFTGNWGYFNIGFILLAVSLLDTQASLFDLAKDPWVSQLTHWPGLAVHLLMLSLFAVSLLYLPNNSWFSRTWLFWPADIAQTEHKWIPRIRRIQRALTPLRWIAPFRLVNGYGVFPPHAMPPVRLVPVFEGSDDGVTWKQYGYKHMPTFAHSRPPFIAPYHARWDQYTYYVTMGIDTSSLFGSLFPLAHPYACNTRVTLLDIMAQRILRHDKTLLDMLGSNPFPDRPPRQVRIGVLGMTPTRLSELRATGHWWHVRRFGTFIPARGLESWRDRNWLPEPELFHPDLLQWKDRARPLQQMLQAYRSGVPSQRAVLEGSDLTTHELESFWGELIPLLATERGNWALVHERYGVVNARFDAERLLRHERILERYAWLLRKRIDPYRFGQSDLSLPPMSNYRYQMLLHEIVLDGRAACETMLREPARAVERFARSSDATQIWALSMFRYEQVMAHVATFRGAEMGLQSRQEGMPGFFEYYDLLVQVTPQGEEFCPRITKHADGEHTVVDFYPPPPLDDGPRPGGAAETRGRRPMAAKGP
jgi:hypothetical protein